MKREHKYMMGGALGVLAIAGVATAGAIIADHIGNASAQQARVVNTGANYARMEPAAGSLAHPAKPPCDDNNIVGTIGGGIAGGVIGAQFGSGSGRTVATTAGALGGAALGNKYMPTRGVTCE